MPNEYFDNGLEDDWIVEQVQDENARQIAKWGYQTRTAFEWLTYTTEELGELAQAISEYEYREGSADDVIREAIHTATLALKIAAMYEDQEQP